MKLGIFANTQKSLVGDVIPGVVDWLQANGAEVVVEKEAAEALHLDVPTAERRQVGRLADLVLAFGGDGTFLAAARDVGPSEVPILGVNLGGLGFLAGVTVGELYPSLEDVLKGNYEILERMVIRAEVEDEDGLVFNCLNDVVIDRGGSPRIAQIETTVDGSYLNTYVADGLIVATPTGSTAYSLSAGGPIVVPTMDAIVLTPLCPHTLSARTVVLSAESVVQAKGYCEDGSLLLSADGQVAYRLRNGQSVTIRRADYNVRWVWTRRKSFYELLRHKLNWGRDLRRG